MVDEILIMKHGSLFSGIGGFDLAAQWMGWENVFHCEWNEFGQKILKHYWPNAISYTDITKTDFTIHANTIDILTGGFPCQPFSLAGKAKGKEDDRYLWPEMLRAIREIRPTWVVGENVYGIIGNGRGLVFEEIKTSLEAEGFSVLPTILPACAVNADHKRERVWIIAYSDCFRQQRRKDFAPQKKSNQQLERLQPAGTWAYLSGPVSYDGKNGLSSNLDGITFSKWRNESNKAAGNAIVPSVAYEIFKAIDQYEQMTIRITEP